MSQKMFVQFKTSQLLLVASLSAFFGSVCTLHAEEPPLKVLVGNDGNTFVGTVEPNQFGYRLVTGDNTRQVVPNQVRCVAESLEDAYRIMSQEMEAFATKNQVQTTSDSHYQLARWCYQYGLYPQCKRELAEALTRNPDNKEAAELAKRFGSRDGDQNSSTDSQFINSLRASKSPDDIKKNLVLQSTQVEVSPLANLPKELAVEFQKMQPVIAANCGKGGCHDQTTNREFVFLHLPPDGGMYRTRLEQNMGELADAMKRAGSIEDFNQLISTRNEHHKTATFPGSYGKDRLEAFTSWTKAYGKHAALPLKSEALAATKIPGQNNVTSPIQQASFEQTKLDPSLIKEANEAKKIQATLEKARQDHQTDAFDPSIFNNRRR